MAKKKTTAKKGLSTGEKAAIGVGLTTAAVAAAGAYFLYGSPNAAKNRKTVKSWMLKAKAEVLETLEKAEHMTEDQFNDVVEKVARTYSAVQGATKGEVAEFKREMKDNWQKLARKHGKKKTAKKGTKKTTKKTAKKKAKK